MGFTNSLLKDDGPTETITPCKWAKHQLEAVDLQEDPKKLHKHLSKEGRWSQLNHHPGLRVIFAKCSGSYKQPSQGTTVPLGPSPLDIVHNAWWRDDPDCHFANFLASFCKRMVANSYLAKLSSLIFWHRAILAK